MSPIRAIAAGLSLCPALVVWPGCSESRSPEAADSRIEELVAQLLPAAERLSGLRATNEIRVERMAPADVRRYIESRLDLYLPGEQLEGLRRSYVMLGLLPDTLDLRALLLDLYGEQVAGFYDPDTEALYIVDASGLQIEPVIVHELVHALQDQYVDLDSLITQRGLNDRQTAAQAAIEGQATLAMFAWLAESMTGDTVDPAALPDPGQGVAGMFAGADQFPVFGRSPRIIRETLLFPYAAGASFVHALWRSRPDRAPPFGDLLPTSTEQVGDPEGRFIGVRDSPTEIRHGAVADWPVIYENTLGALETAILIGEVGGGGADGASGWDGDRFTLYRGPGGDVLVWTSVWDDPASADRFTSDIAALFPDPASRPGGIQRIDIEGRPGVRITIGAEPETAPDPTVTCTDAEGGVVAC